LSRVSGQIKIRILPYQGVKARISDAGKSMKKGRPPGTKSVFKEGGVRKKKFLGKRKIRSQEDHMDSDLNSYLKTSSSNS